MRQFFTQFSSNFSKWFGFPWPGWVRTPIWVVIFAVLAGLMVYELQSNLDDFQHNNIVPEINVVVNEMTPPYLTVCAPYYSRVIYVVADWVVNEAGRKRDPSIPYRPCPECEGMINNSWDVWRDEEIFAQVNDSNAHQLLMTSLVKKVVANIETAREILLKKTNAYWNQAIVDALWQFVSCKAAKDDDFFNSRPIGSLITIRGNCDSNYLSSLDYLSSETIDQLFDLLFDCMELYIDLFITIPSKRNSSVPLKSVEVFMPLSTLMCIRLPPLSTHMALRYNFSGLTPVTSEPYFPWSRPNEKPDIQGVFRVYEDSLLYVPGDSYLTLLESDPTPMSIDPSKFADVTYSLLTYMDVSRQDNTCSADNVPMSCKAKLQYDEAVKYCRCVPLRHRYLRGNDTDLPYCNAVSYEACDQFKPTFSDYTHCTKRCQYASYKFSIQRSSPVSRPDAYGIGVFMYTLGLTQTNGSTLKISFTHKTTLGQFMSQIGGTLNLYLGLSGITICTFIFFLIDRAKRCSAAEPGNTNSDQRATPIFGLHVAWFLRAMQAAATQDAANNAINKIETEFNKMETELKIMADRLDALEGKTGGQNIQTRL